jgi:hypothetical protein
MNRKARRKANAKGGKLLRLSNGCRIKVTETINLSDPNLAPEHRARFIMAVKSGVAELDELIASWYRHRGECCIEGCDCGGDDLAEQAITMCNHIWFIREKFGETLVDGYPHFNRFLKEGLEPGAYEMLASHKTQ